MIEVEDLRKNYGVTKALRGVTFEIPKGQVVGLLGPNGAGKSTTMRIVTGFLAPTSGRARVDQIDVLDDPRGAQRQIGYLPEGNPLYLDLRVSESLRFTAAMRGLRGSDRQNAINDAIQAVGLEGRERSLISSLSRGFRQRVGLAQALLHRPPILILDEPTSGLDPNQQEDMRVLMRRLGETRTVVLSTHILSEVEAVCDRALIISNGNMAADGTINEIRESAHMGSGIAMVVRGGLDQARAAVSSLPMVKSIHIASVDGDAERVRVLLELGGDIPRDALESAAAAVQRAGLPLSELRTERASLGEVFAGLTSGTVAPGVALPGDAAQRAETKTNRASSAVEGGASS